MRNRTAKFLGRRHDPNYVKKLTLFRYWRRRLGWLFPAAVFRMLAVPGRFRFWRRVLGWGLSAVAALILIVLAILPFKITATVYSPGPLSPAHAFIADRCDRCHTEMVQGKRKWTPIRPASDDACLSCHQSPAHHFGEKQPSPPTCASCHTEHQGAVQLVQVKDRQCLNCHSSLKKHFGDTKFLNVSGFNGKRHPEFEAVRDRPSNLPRSTIIFPHGLHMGDTMRTINGEKLKPEDQTCDNCHRPLAGNDGRKWQFAEASIPIEEKRDRIQHRHPDAGREHMNMPSYEKHCAQCHALEFENVKIQHPKHPENTKEVDDFLRKAFKSYIQQNPQELNPGKDRTIPESKLAPAPRNADDWVTQKVAQAEAFLWSKSCVGQEVKRPCTQLNTCGDCHVLSYPASSTPQPMTLPRVDDSHYRLNQMGNAVFSHEAHSAFTCQSCHVYQKQCCATALPDTFHNGPDISLPGIATCQSCHNGSPPATGKAENGCFLCHQYHKWNQRDAWQPDGFKASETIEDLNGFKQPEFHWPVK